MSDLHPYVPLAKAVRLVYPCIKVMIIPERSERITMTRVLRSTTTLSCCYEQKNFGDEATARVAVLHPVRTGQILVKTMVQHPEY